MSSSDLRRPGVLIVDGDETSLAALTEALAPVGCDVVGAHSTADARAEVARRSWDVIALSLPLPDGDGLALAAGLRADGKLGAAQLLFLCAGEPGDEVLDAMLAIGGADFLVRPIRPALFRARVRTQTRLSARERDLLGTERAFFEAMHRLTATNVRRKSGAFPAYTSPSTPIAAAEAALETLRESEERYRLAARASNDLLWDWDLRSPSVFYGATLATAFGHPIAVKDGLCEVDVAWRREQIHPEDLARVEQTLAEAIRTATETWTQEYRFRLGNGEWAHVIDRACVVRNSHGVAVRMVGALQDLTELKAQAAQLEARADFQQQLVGIVSHDLRNPIGAIHLGASAMLMRGDLSDPQKAYANQIVRASERASRMVRDLLDFTRLRLGGGIPIQPRSSDLRSIAEQVVRETQSAHPDRRVSLSVEGETTGVWDADRIAQLVSNLLGNAVAYGPREATVTVRVEGADTEARLAVHNGGDPIPADLLPHLFEPLRRGEGGSGSSRSIGLGLYIVQNIARAHGGRVEVQSTAEAGTTFTVHLPRQPTAASSKSSGMFSIRALKAAQEAAKKKASA